MARKALGRGISALLGEEESYSDPGWHEIDVSLIDPNPGQTRENFSKEKLNEKEEKATADIQKELDKHEEDLAKAEVKASEVALKLQEQLQQALQTGQTGVIRLQVSQEDRKKLEQSQAQAEAARDTARKAIRRIKKKRTSAVTSLRNSIKWYSIAGMPFLISLFGIGLAIQTRKRAQSR